MTRTIADRIVENADRGFVGREREVAALREAATVDEPAFLVAFVHGPGGIGKTRLLRRLLAELSATGTRGILLDGREVEPTPRGVGQALGRALGIPGADPDRAVIGRALSAHPRTMLVVDSYEHLRLIDHWLRTTFLPGLPATVLTVLAGRDPPSASWHTTAGWSGMVAEFGLTALPPADAVRLLLARGLDRSQARRANRFARGHPLALELTAATMRADPSWPMGSNTSGPTVPTGLLEAFLGQLPAATVQAVEAASTVRRVSEPILRAVLDVDDGRTVFDELRALPFTEATGEGLVLHDVVRETVADELAMRDPETRRTYRRRAAAYLTARAAHPQADAWRTTADLMFLIENPVVREACFPSARPNHAVELALPGDAPAVAEIIARHETPTAAAALTEWWQRHPETFSVARDRDGAVAAFVQVAELDATDRRVFARDPVAARWTEHLRAAPPRAGDRVLLMRRWLGRDSGELRSPAVSACWLDVKRIYMELRPRLRRIYSVIEDLPRLGPIFVPLGFAPVGEPIPVDDVTQQAVWLDFGPGSVDGWLARLVGSETDPAPVAAAPAVPASEAGLSARELAVLRLLADGLSNRKIGTALFISEKTAGRHVSNIFGKLGVHSRTEAARTAAEQGLLHS